jgi:hypothetical protein
VTRTAARGIRPDCEAVSGPGRASFKQDVDYSCAFADLRDNGEMGHGELRTKAGLARLSHLLMPISGQPEIGAPETGTGFFIG